MSWSMETIYLSCAVAGGTVLVLQTALLLFGGGDHSDALAGHPEHVDLGQADSGEGSSHDSALGLLSVRSISAFLTFFGLAGWGGINAGWSTFGSLCCALIAGTVMLALVAYLLTVQRKLYSEGNLNPRNAIGSVARVYLRIPAHNSGRGKITVALQGRTAEFGASTEELPTGTEVRIVRLLTQDTFEVESFN